MNTLMLTGWKKGLDTVHLIKAIKAHTGKSLAESKQLVTALLDGNSILLQFEDPTRRETFRTEALSLGALCGG